MPAFAIGIDLGTTNCALAYLPLEEEAIARQPAILPIPQRESAGGEIRAPTLPSFLAWAPGATGWEAGQRARTLAGEIPGRVISSAKSWLAHPAIDRQAPFLPFGSEDLAEEQRLSPVAAATELLRHLRQAWEAAHPEAPLQDQAVAVTVPASFDPVAQQLTLQAAWAAGLPPSTTLLEEPQAAFLAWLAQADEDALRALGPDGSATILVVDLGGGTTDFSLFVWRAKAEKPLERVAVSDHILLGGDNLDLALAHFLEERLSPQEPLPATTLARLVARCREIKEEALLALEPTGQSWSVAVPRPGASLLTGTLRTEIDEDTVRRLLLEGFFPEVSAREFPLRSGGGLRELGLPYARDPAITRHLAEFLRDRPAPDAVLFNGGTTKAPAVRARLAQQLQTWQGGREVVVLAQAEADLSVARGAAWHLARRAQGADRFEAGAPRAYYVAVGANQAVCVLPQGAATETTFIAAPPGLRALVGHPVSLAMYQHSRRPADRAGEVVTLDGSFQPLPPVETLLRPPPGGRKAPRPEVRVALHTRLRATGLLRLELHCAEPALKWKEPWLLDFNLRARGPGPAPAKATATAEPSDLSAQAVGLLSRAWNTAVARQQKITGNQLLALGEQALARPRAEWSGVVVRSLAEGWLAQTEQLVKDKKAPAVAEEAWWQVSGFLLRPGWGVPGDAERMAHFAALALASAQNGVMGRAVKIQFWIALRRVAPGLPESSAEALWKVAEADWKGAPPPAELMLLAGSLESLSRGRREHLAERLLEVVAAHPQTPAAWRALGRVLSRVPARGGQERILPPAVVEAAWERLGTIEVPESARLEAGSCWLRAARLTDLRTATVSASVREAIGRLLRKWGWEETRRRVLREVVPLVAAEHNALLGEAPPPGLRLEN